MFYGGATKENTSAKTISTKTTGAIFVIQIDKISIKILFGQPAQSNWYPITQRFDQARWHLRNYKEY